MSKSRRSPVMPGTLIPLRLLGLFLFLGLPQPTAAQTQAPAKSPTQTPTQPPPKSKGAGQASPAPTADPVALMRQLTELFTAGKYTEAIDVAKRIIAAFEQMGAGEHPLQAGNYAALGDLYKHTGNFAEAERNLRRALAMREKAFGPEHADVAASLVRSSLAQERADAVAEPGHVVPSDRAPDRELHAGNDHCERRNSSADDR